MMSGPVPDWIAEVIRACTSLPLMVSTLSVMPVALWHSCVIWPLSSTSEAGTKSASAASGRWSPVRMPALVRRPGRQRDGPVVVARGRPFCAGDWAPAGLWLAIVASGLYHGVNPGMGWPLVVSAGLMKRT